MALGLTAVQARSVVRFSLSRLTTDEEIERADPAASSPGAARETALPQGRRVIIECDRCYARYRYDEGRFEGKSSKKVRCTKCLSVFEIYNTPAFEASAARSFGSGSRGAGLEAEGGHRPREGRGAQEGRADGRAAPERGRAEASGRFQAVPRRDRRPGFRKDLSDRQGRASSSAARAPTSTWMTRRSPGRTPPWRSPESK